MGNQTLEKVLYDPLLEMEQSLSSSGINVQLGMKKNRKFRREALKLVPILGGQLFVRVFPPGCTFCFHGNLHRVLHSCPSPDPVPARSLSSPASSLSPCAVAA